MLDVTYVTFWRKFTVRHVGVLKGQGAGEELLESAGNFFGLFRAERVSRQVQVGEGRRATPHQRHKERVERGVRRGEVQDGNLVGLSEETAQSVAVLLDGIPAQIEVC